MRLPTNLTTNDLALFSFRFVLFTPKIAERPRQLFEVPFSQIELI